MDGSSGNDRAKKDQRFKYATLNIEGLGEKEEELDKLLNENNIKIATITESKKKLQGTKNTKNYTVIYSGVNRNIRGQSGVMIWIHRSIEKKIAHYKYWSDRIIEARIKITRGYLTILGLYAPNEGKEESSIQFYEELQQVVNKINKNDNLILLGDLNARIGNTKISNIVGTNGEPTVNNNGKKLIDFCTFNNLRIMNTFFKHKNIHKFTWSARGTQSIIDYCITNEKTAKLILDVRVYRGIKICTDHNLLCATIKYPPRWLNKNKNNNNIKENLKCFLRLDY